MAHDTPQPARPAFLSRSRISLLVGAGLVTLFVLSAFLAPWITAVRGQGPFDQVTDRTVTPPTPPEPRHPLGTDMMGRDQLSRLLHGARISLQVGLIAEAIALLLGTSIGALAGYAGGRTDALLMRGCDLALAFPAPLLALAIVAAVPEPESAPFLRLLPHPSIGIMVLVLGLLGWAGIARLVRGELLKVREQEFAQAAEAIGAPGLRVVLRHLLPNAAGPLIVAASLGIGSNILMEAWLSFLGVGARPPLPSWGTMVTEGQSLFLGKPWVCIAPGLAILMTVLGFNLLGDGVRDLMDPRRKRAAA